jgi:uncharacterized protein (DUF2225 family)
MKNESIQQICCNHCGYEFARVEEQGGKQKLIVHPPELALKVLSKQPDVFVAVCPKCKYETVIDIELLRRF